MVHPLFVVRLLPRRIFPLCGNAGSKAILYILRIGLNQPRSGWRGATELQIATIRYRYGEAANPNGWLSWRIPAQRYSFFLCESLRTLRLCGCFQPQRRRVRRDSQRKNFLTRLLSSRNRKPGKHNYFPTPPVIPKNVHKRGNCKTRIVLHNKAKMVEKAGFT
uniref:Uncharacterized protein n=1 Tax=Candidatus Kentrum sp. DK TaxID=2126562 RepID=A0A450SVL9_9GAMM|nr:MAG: hypothetical protein BECKDK2373B_GA0170837_106923 [Candidatus Kentron sp. DK]